MSGLWEGGDAQDDLAMEILYHPTVGSIAKTGISRRPTGFQDVLKRIRSDAMQKLEFHLIFGFGSKFKEGPQIPMSMFRINLMIIGVPNVDP